MTYVCVSGNREQLRSIARDILHACDTGPRVMESRYEGAMDNETGELVALVFSNDDMEDRDDLRAGAVIIDHNLRGSR